MVVATLANNGCPKVNWNCGAGMKMWLVPKSAPMAADEISGEDGGGSSSIFLTASPSATADASGNRPGSGRGSENPLSLIFTMHSICLTWIHSSRFCLHSPGIGMAIWPTSTGLSSTWIPRRDSSSMLSSSSTYISLGECMLAAPLGIAPLNWGLFSGGAGTKTSYSGSPRQYQPSPNSLYA